MIVLCHGGPMTRVHVCTCTRKVKTANCLQPGLRDVLRAPAICRVGTPADHICLARCLPSDPQAHWTARLPNDCCDVHISIQIFAAQISDGTASQALESKICGARVQKCHVWWVCPARSLFYSQNHVVRRG